MAQFDLQRRHWRCPYCGQTFSIPANAADPAACPDCGGSAPADDSDADWEAPRMVVEVPGSGSAPGGADHSLSLGPGGFRCPFCGTNSQPEYHSQISTGGWILFAALLFFCFPICWLGFLVKEEFARCSDCGIKLG